VGSRPTEFARKTLEEDQSDDPAVTVWREWRDAYKLTERLCHEQQRLAPISHIVEVHRGPESEKVVLRQQLSFDRGTSRCKQSVAQNDLILHLLKSAPLWPALTAERSPPTPARFCWGWRTGLSEWLIALPAASWTSAM